MIEREIHLGEHWDESDRLISLATLYDVLGLLKEYARCKFSPDKN